MDLKYDVGNSFNFLFKILFNLFLEEFLIIIIIVYFLKKFYI